MPSIADKYTPRERQRQDIRDKIYEAELLDKNEWTYAKVQETVKAASMFTAQLSPCSTKYAEIRMNWPTDVSVDYNWFKHISSDPDIDFGSEKPALSHPNIVYFILLRWLELIDSVRDRKVLIWNACGITISDIARKLNVPRQTISQRHSKLIRELVHKMNHYQDKKYYKVLKHEKRDILSTRPSDYNSMAWKKGKSFYDLVGWSDIK